MQTVLMLTLLICEVVSPFCTRCYRKGRERAAVAALRKAGGFVRYDWQIPPRAGPPGPVWTRALLGDDFFSDIVYVSTVEGRPQDFTDTDMAHLRGVTTVKWLRLRYGRISGAGLGSLGECQQLVSVDLAYTRARGACLGELGKLPRLKNLCLSGTPIDDESLQHLRRCGSLEILELEATNISGAGLGAIAELPKLVELDLEASKATSEGIKSIRAAKNLRILWLEDTSIDDQALEAISGIKSLRVLAISSPNITNAGVRYLVRLPKLRELLLAGEQLSDEGIAALSRSRSITNLEVDGGAVSRQAKEALYAELKCEVGLTRDTHRSSWPSKRAAILRGD